MTVMHLFTIFILILIIIIFSDILLALSYNRTLEAYLGFTNYVAGYRVMIFNKASNVRMPCGNRSEPVIIRRSSS